MANIAFIGLGNMGGPMSANLVKAQHKVRGFDLVAELRSAAESEGVQIASSAQDAVKGAEVVITMLPQGQHVLSVWRDIIEAVPAGALMIDCSTIDVASSREAHAIAAARGLDVVDAPVSGGTAGAKAATLTLMAGGSDQAVARAPIGLRCRGDAGMEKRDGSEVGGIGCRELHHIVHPGEQARLAHMGLEFRKDLEAGVKP